MIIVNISIGVIKQQTENTWVGRIKPSRFDTCNKPGQQPVKLLELERKNNKSLGLVVLTCVLVLQGESVVFVQHIYTTGQFRLLYIKGDCYPGDVIFLTLTYYS